MESIVVSETRKGIRKVRNNITISIKGGEEV